MSTEPRLSDFTRQIEQHQGVLDCVRWLSLKGATHLSDADVFDAFSRQYPRSPFVLQTKAAIGPGDTTTPAWAGVLVQPPGVAPVFARITEQALPAKLGLRRVPFNAPVPVQTTWATFSWIAENAIKPAVKWSWASVTVPPKKYSGVVPLTKELVRLGGADAISATALITDAVAWQDTQLITDIVSGVVPITATGTTLVDQVDELITALYTTRPNTARPMLVTRADLAQTLTRQSQSDRGFFGLTPLVVSEGAGSRVVALDGNGVVYAEDPRGDALDTSDEATLELDSAPVGGAAAVLTSLWQNGLIGIRLDRMINWIKTETNVVQVLTVS